MEKVISKTRPPIVCVLGHVDHGKTTLLDKIRNTGIAQKEVGGITQSIGASVFLSKEGKEITFIDTPGHAAFSSMRARGTKIADIAVLVVAADDGIYPQTKEALKYILDSNISFIVAITKIDLPSADIEAVKTQLGKEGILLEGSGGNVPYVCVSGKTGEKVEELIEVIFLVAEMMNILGDPEKPLEAYVFETGKDRRGSFASVVVKNGSLSVGDEIMTESTKSKVRGVFDYKGFPLKKVMPGYPCQIIGFTEVPSIGSPVWRVGEKESGLVIERKRPVVEKIAEDEIPIVIKANNAGSLEAVIANLPEKVVVIDSGVGDLTESDVFMAKSANAQIYIFESKASSSVKKLADMEGVNILYFDIIYKLFENLEEQLEKDKKKILGKAEIIQIFPFNNRKVAGCKVIEGEIKKTNPLFLYKGENLIGKIKVISLKKEKHDIELAKQGEEFGIIFVPQLEFAIGDMIISLQ